MKKGENRLPSPVQPITPAKSNKGSFFITLMLIMFLALLNLFSVYKIDVMIEGISTNTEMRVDALSYSLDDFYKTTLEQNKHIDNISTQINQINILFSNQSIDDELKSRLIEMLSTLSTDISLVRNELYNLDVRTQVNTNMISSLHKFLEIIPKNIHDFLYFFVVSLFIGIVALFIVHHCYLMGVVERDFTRRVS